MIQHCIQFAYFSMFFDNRQHHKVPQITRYSMFNQSPKRKAVGSNPAGDAKTADSLSGFRRFSFCRHSIMAAVAIAISATLRYLFPRAKGGIRLLFPAALPTLR